MQFILAVFAKQSRSDRERAYLNQSVSLYDLERREREVSAGKFAD
jgi:hypothetical protein